MASKANPVTIGIFVSVAFLLGILSIIYLGVASAFKNSPSFILYFEDSVNGLSEGSPVKFKGVPVGRVKQIFIRKNQDPSSDAVPVLIEIDEEHVTSLGISADLDDPLFLKERVDEFGLRAKLEFISYVTGLLYVELDFHSDVGDPQYVQLPDKQDYLEIPTLNSSIADIQKQIAKAATSLAKIDIGELSDQLTFLLENAGQLIADIPVKELSSDIVGSVRKFREILESGEIEEAISGITAASTSFKTYGDTLNEITPEISQKLVDSLDSLNDVLGEIDSLVDNRYGLHASMNETLEKISRASEAVRRLSSYLERNPNALLSGRK